MRYYSCLNCEETAKRVGAIEDHIQENHDVEEPHLSDRWELVEGDPDHLPGSTTFLGDFA